MQMVEPASSTFTRKGECLGMVSALHLPVVFLCSVFYSLPPGTPLVTPRERELQTLSPVCVSSLS